MVEEGFRFKNSLNLNRIVNNQLQRNPKLFKLTFADFSIHFLCRISIIIRSKGFEKIQFSIISFILQKLNAIDNLVQNSRPAFRNLRNYAMTRYQKSSATMAATTAEATESNIQKRSLHYELRHRDE